MGVLPLPEQRHSSTATRFVFDVFAFLLYNTPDIAPDMLKVMPTITLFVVEDNYKASKLNFEFTKEDLKGLKECQKH